MHEREEQYISQTKDADVIYMHRNRDRWIHAGYATAILSTAGEVGKCMRHFRMRENLTPAVRRTLVSDDGGEHPVYA